MDERKNAKASELYVSKYNSKKTVKFETFVHIFQLSETWQLHVNKSKVNTEKDQFIGGIGIPADLEYESLTVGYVLKAMFYLPWNATVFRENPFFPEYKVEDDNFLNEHTEGRKRSGFRWDIYAYIMNRLQNYGYNGQECLLKVICEANSVRFERHYNIFAELMHILLSPSTSSDHSSSSSNFKEAEKYGRSGESCNIYACNMSLLNLISSVLKVED